MTELATSAEIVESIREQTAHLLGTTISYGSGDWTAPTALPGWTRAHIAAHLIEGALCMLDALDDSPAYRARTVDERRVALERRALSSGLELQIELDETAGRLQDRLAQLGPDDDRPINVSPTWQLPANCLPLLRLREIVIHHFDLIGDDALDLPTPMLQELLKLEIERPRKQPLRPVLLLSDEGFSAKLGDDEATSTVIGPAPDLLKLLARGITSPNISGVESTSPRMEDLVAQDVPTTAPIAPLDQ